MSKTYSIQCFLPGGICMICVDTALAHMFFPWNLNHTDLAQRIVTVKVGSGYDLL